jgi:putative ABC transport system permease protein
MIGTIISAAMITAVATLGFSFMDLMQRQCIASSGEWHAIYPDVNSKQLEMIKSDKQIKTAIISKEPGYAYLEGSQNTNKPYLYIKEYSSEGYSHNPIHLLEGRLPVKPDELLISEDVRTNAKVDYQVGDVIELSIGSRISDGVLTDQKELNQMNSLIWDQDKVAESLTSDFTRTYTIVGIMERPEWELTWSPGYTALSYIDEKTVTAGETFDVSVIFNKINNKLSYAKIVCHGDVSLGTCTRGHDPHGIRCTL